MSPLNTRATQDPVLVQACMYVCMHVCVEGLGLPHVVCVRVCAGANPPRRLALPRACGRRRGARLRGGHHRPHRSVRQAVGWGSAAHDALLVHDHPTRLPHVREALARDTQRHHRRLRVPSSTHSLPACVNIPVCRNRIRMSTHALSRLCLWLVLTPPCVDTTTTPRELSIHALMWLCLRPLVLI
jgi:hypothetical protein